MPNGMPDGWTVAIILGTGFVLAFAGSLIFNRRKSMVWSIWDDKGKITSNLTEKEAREFLRANDSREVYAENDLGDIIEEADGEVQS